MYAAIKAAYEVPNKAKAGRGAKANKVKESEDNQAFGSESQEAYQKYFGNANEEGDINVSDDKDFTPAGSIDDNNSVGNLDEEQDPYPQQDTHKHQKSHKKGEKKNKKEKKDKKHKKEKKLKLARGGEDIGNEPKSLPNYDKSDNNDEEDDTVGRKRGRKRQQLVDDDSGDDD